MVDALLAMYSTSAITRRTLTIRRLLYLEIMYMQYGKTSKETKMAIVAYPLHPAQMVDALLAMYSTLATMQENPHSPKFLHSKIMFMWHGTLIGKMRQAPCTVIGMVFSSPKAPIMVIVLAKKLG